MEQVAGLIYIFAFNCCPKLIYIQPIDFIIDCFYGVNELAAMMRVRMLREKFHILSQRTLSVCSSFGRSWEMLSCDNIFPSEKIPFDYFPVGLISPT